MSDLRRRYSVRMKVEADDWKSFRAGLHELFATLNHTSGDADRVDLVIAKHAYSYTAFGVQQPDITAEEYHRRLESYVNEQVTKIS